MTPEQNVIPDYGDDPGKKKDDKKKKVPLKRKSKLPVQNAVPTYDTPAILVSRRKAIKYILLGIGAAGLAATVVLANKKGLGEIQTEQKNNAEREMEILLQEKNGVYLAVGYLRSKMIEDNTRGDDKPPINISDPNTWRDNFADYYASFVEVAKRNPNAGIADTETNEGRLDMAIRETLIAAYENKENGDSDNYPKWIIREIGGVYKQSLEGIVQQYIQSREQ